MPPQQKGAPPKGRMFSIQAALPKFPVAPLDQTLDKYLKTLKPLLTEEEYANTEKIVAKFQKGVGLVLQAKLEEKAKTETNWLSDWWKQVAYLDVRESCVINSNPGVLFPKADYNTLDGQLSYAARLISGMLDYKQMIDYETLPVEHLGKNPLCMMQYYQILSACRIPGIKHDDWRCFPPDSPFPPRHITVIYNNNIYEVPVYGEDGEPLNQEQIRVQLQEVVNLGQTPGDGVGIFTMENRNSWAKAYKKMVKDKVNKESLFSVQRSILVLCLDKPLTDPADQRSLSGHQMLHGGGPAHNSSNRWFDKTIQFIVGAEGYSGLNYEHTTAEGPPVIHLMDHCIKYLASTDDRPVASGLMKPVKLQLNLTSEVKEKLQAARDSSQRMVDDLDLKVFVFDEFGKDVPKSQKVSPDSFIQNAIQLAYYRHHKESCGSYESASIRMFQLGRTDTIRSCSSESFAFTQAMLDNSVSNQKKAELMRKAIQAHKNYTNDAISGRGVDRHLLGLKLTAIENGMHIPSFFMDPAYIHSCYWKISTSQVPAKSESVLFFGPVVPDGYGFCYNPQERAILFGVSSYRSNEKTLPAGDMAELVRQSLCDMRNVLGSTVRANL